VVAEIVGEIGGRSDSWLVSTGNNPICHPPIISQTQIPRPTTHHHTNHFVISQDTKNKKDCLDYIKKSPKLQIFLLFRWEFFMTMQ
jgi:hypothetical protein